MRGDARREAAEHVDSSGSVDDSGYYYTENNNNDGGGGDDDDDEAFVPPIPFRFPNVVSGGDLYLRIHCNKSRRTGGGGSDLTDRAAAIALQSWYELSKLEEEQSVGGGDRSTRNSTDAAAAYRFLQPFWTAYSAETSHRSCSLELAFVLVQFCCAIGRVHEAIELAAATLHRVFGLRELTCYGGSNDDAQRDRQQQDDVLREYLVFVICETLPYCSDAEAVSAALRQFKEPNWTPSAEWEDDDFRWELSPLASVDSTRAVLGFLEHPPIHWPDEFKSVLGDCQERLDRLLNKTLLLTDSSRSSSVSPTNREHQSLVMGSLPMSAAREGRTGRYSLLPTLGWDGGVRHWLQRVVYLTRICIVNPLILSERRWENSGKAALTVWSFWVAWRQRTRIYRGSTKALKFFLKPLLEIIEALIVPPSANGRRKPISASQS